MAKPRLIILVRHAQSEGNKNREIHQTTPDHRVKLTPDGWSQAYHAGRRLRALLRPDDTLHFFTSPYRRARETTEGILTTLTADNPEPSPFRRASIKVDEEPRLREQDFGNFQPCSAEMERMWQERADYGHFFYRIPSGESAADAYDRISGFNESLWRQFGEDDFASVCVLVTHGLMSRVFLMKWYHFTVEYFEDLRNINHCEFLIMRQQVNGKYLLETKLRTWSELRREHAAMAAQNRLLEGQDDDDGRGIKDEDEEDKTEKKRKLGICGVSPPRCDAGRSNTVPRRWGGCPNGCNHTSHYNKREDLEALRQQDGQHAAVSSAGGSSMGDGGARKLRGHQHIPSSDENDLEAAPAHNPVDAHASSLTRPRADGRLWRIASPYLYVGRDGGGTYSGRTSIAGSDTDLSEDESLQANHHHHQSQNHHIASLNGRLLSTAAHPAGSAEPSASPTLFRRHTAHDMASPGDSQQLPAPSPHEHPASTSHNDGPLLDEAERIASEERSIQGSVF